MFALLMWLKTCLSNMPCAWQLSQGGNTFLCPYCLANKGSFFFAMHSVAGATPDGLTESYFWLSGRLLSA